MKERKKLIRNIALHLAFLSLLLWACPGCSRDSATDSPKGRVGEEQHGHTEADTHEGHDHHEGHGEEAHEEGLSLSLDEIAEVRCEHDVPAYQCASCRYEVGVVKVPPSLVKEDPQAENGLIRTRLVEKIGVTDGLTVTGEVQLNENTAVHISPRIPGIIESVQVDMGARVREGDVLFNINSVELGKALSDYERNRSLAALSGKNFDREKSLFKRRISSEQEMIEAQMTYEQHKAERDAARQVLHVLDLTDEVLASIDQGFQLSCHVVKENRSGGNNDVGLMDLGVDIIFHVVF